MEGMDKPARGARLAEQTAGAVGSWTFIGAQAGVMALWVLINTLQLTHVVHFDTYPFVFLNLAMSAEAAFTGPVLLIAANVGAGRDRAQAARTEALAELNERQAEMLTTLVGHVEQIAQADHVEHGRLLLEQSALLKELHSHTTCAGHTTVGDA